MKIGIYNHQHMQGSCPICRQTYVQGMMQDALSCQSKAHMVYGSDLEFVNYTDLGNYPPENLDRPGFRRMMQDVEDGRLDVIIVIRLDKISNDVDLILNTYERMKAHGVELLTLKEGKRAMEVLDKALIRRAEKQQQSS